MRQSQATITQANNLGIPVKGSAAFLMATKGKFRVEWKGKQKDPSDASSHKFLRRLLLHWV
ncbi:hypothetical protein DK880_00945 [Candidatus Cardinium hertigii]|uniref:Uncharacterized protein n=1 Tax=Candidatus Cardinium hertigii TaxID=247481 RepID=A0A2Z3LDU1_9BACT|nr:hypothetical protein DK880_00945 [Candidatus Cardinium hertigii]